MDIDRSELKRWLEMVDRISPRGNRLRRRLSNSPSRLVEWCTLAPGQVLSVLNDEDELRTLTVELLQAERRTRKEAESIRSSLRRQIGSFHAVSSDLEQALEFPDKRVPAERVRRFVEGVNTLRKHANEARRLTTVLGEPHGRELVDAIQMTQADPRKSGRLVAGIQLALQVRNLEQSELSNQATIKQAPDQLTRRLQEQKESIERTQSRIDALDRQIETERDRHVAITAQREQAELRESQINDDLEQLDARFDVLLAYAKLDSTIDSRALYEAYRERTDRERVWHERELSDAHARELQSELNALQRRCGQLQQGLEECDEERIELLNKCEEMRAQISHLWDRINELDVENCGLEASLEAARNQLDFHAFMAMDIGDLDFTPGLELALRSGGIHSLGQLLEAFPHDVAQIPGIGTAKMQQIAEALADQGLHS